MVFRTNDLNIHLSWKCQRLLVDMLIMNQNAVDFLTNCVFWWHQSSANTCTWSVPDDDQEKKSGISYFFFHFWSLYSKQRALNKQNRNMHAWKCKKWSKCLALYRCFQHVVGMSKCDCLVGIFQPAVTFNNSNKYNTDCQLKNPCEGLLWAKNALGFSLSE